MNGHIELPAPIGLGSNLKEGSDESSGPPRFEDFKSALVRSKQGTTVLEGPHGLSERRQTRSQLKKAKEMVTNRQKHLSRVSAGSMSREGSFQASKSPETTESIAKLAKESIEVGEMLGIKVIGKKEAAVKNLVSSLKNGRKALINSRR